MANTLLVPNQIARGALAILHNNLRFTRTVSRSIRRFFRQDRRGSATRFESVCRTNTRTSTGAALSIQDTTNRVIALTIGTNTIGTPSAAPALAPC